MKKTFSKKRNQRKAIYAGSAIVIVSLLFGIWVQQVHAQQDKQQLQQSIQQIRTDKEQKIETLSKDLHELQTQKAVTDTQLQEKAASEAQKQSEIDKLKQELSAKQAEEARIAALPKSRTGGMGGSYSGTGSGDFSGNTYSYGYCTWYVANRRPDIPNSWGDAYEWLGNARAQGWATGSTPRAGAIGQTSGGALGHVVYVERVNGDGTILISEMNYQGWNVQSSRTADASSFNYIY